MTERYRINPVKFVATALKCSNSHAKRLIAAGAVWVWPDGIGEGKERVNLKDKVVYYERKE